MTQTEGVRDACPVCGAMLAEGDERCPRCGADVTRDRTLEHPVAAPAETASPDPQRARGRAADGVEPPEDVDYRERKPSYEAGFRPPAPDDD